MGVAIVNGKKYKVPDSGSVSIVNGKVFVNGVDITKGEEPRRLDITIQGPVGDITCDGALSVDGDVNGNVKCGGSCNVDGDVRGSVQCGGSCNVDGSVYNGGTISNMNKEPDNGSLRDLAKYTFKELKSYLWGDDYNE